VGSTEANIRQALKIIDAMSPCVVMVDEVEKALAGLASSGSTDLESLLRLVESPKRTAVHKTEGQELAKTVLGEKRGINCLDHAAKLRVGSAAAKTKVKGSYVAYPCQPHARDKVRASFGGGSVRS